MASFRGTAPEFSTITKDGQVTIRPACPPTGSNTRAVHKWLYHAAKECKVFCRTVEQAFEIIAAGTAGCGRTVAAREINDTLATVYGSGTDKRSVVRPAVFDPDLLASRAAMTPFEVTTDWFAEVSPASVIDV